MSEVSGLISESRMMSHVFARLLNLLESVSRCRGMRYLFYPDVGVEMTDGKNELSIKFYLTKWNFKYIFYAWVEKSGVRWYRVT